MERWAQVNRASMRLPDEKLSEPLRARRQCGQGADGGCDVTRAGRAVSFVNCTQLQDRVRAEV